VVAMSRDARIAVFISSFVDGGVERMLLNLSRGFADLGHRVDFVVGKAQGRYLSLLPSECRMVDLGTSHPLKILPPLSRYLRRERPAIMLSSKEPCSRATLRGRKLAGVSLRLFFRIATTPSERDRRRNVLKRWRSLHAMRTLYRKADGLIAVSRGAAADVAAIAGIPGERIHVVPNPVVAPELQTLAASPVDHPWFITPGPPIILAVGAFRRAKDFPTLIRAFARIRGERDLRLLILGRGRQRTKVEKLAEALGVRGDLSLPGFAVNPYAYMAKASLLVVSSAWEGSPNVLVEALAVGTPVVATACRSGPREILQDERYGPLVPVGDAEAMAAAIMRTLDAPLPAETLKVAAEPYHLHVSCRRYLEAFGMEAGQAMDDRG
jgi:glycosyltransferase involved in cell wall biosynthesis